MGVPAFFRWLSRKYPSIVVHCDSGVKGQYHFDNLYLDMNGIIHPCSHPENKPPPETEEEMFLAIFEYVENILKIVKPKKLLYMAVDGVAPRAKMNQQRSRRFRAAQESHEKLIQIQQVKEDLEKQGIEVQEKKSNAHFDSNVITPGTDFMVNLSEALRSWIDRRLSDDYDDVDGIWPKDLMVVLSDASVPGEGEHKIMDYIRRQKADKNYDPNLSHCLYGADADLIMLGLATHEPNFTILREEFKPNQPRPCDLCGQLGHDLKDCTGQAKPLEDLPIAAETEFIYIRLNVLREYLQKECQKDTTANLEFERFIDDYVFLCFFVGNDFLPHLPSLEIRENAIDRLIKLYKYVMEKYPESGDQYLTKNGFVNKNRVQYVLQELGEYEDEIFKQRQQSDQNFKERNKRRKLMEAEKDLRWMKPESVSQRPETFHDAKGAAHEVRMAFKNEADAKLNSMLVNPSDNGGGRKRKRDEESDSEPEDHVQLHREGWKQRYYFHKFGTESVEEISRLVSQEYFKGLCWVMLYYYQGCPDWKWFFPFHYAPFASDFQNVENIEVKFDYDAKPFQPLEQLMSVFPAASSKNLPPTWRDLMMNPKSPIIDFYPTTFRIDLNGKRAAWMGVALLPFIDEDRLFKALESLRNDLTEQEKMRNRLGSHLMFISRKNSSLSKEMVSVIGANSPEKTPISTPERPHFNLVSGTFRKSQMFSDAYQKSICCEFYDPQYQKKFVFAAMLKANAAIPAPVLKPQDIDRFQRYRPIIGMNPRNNQAHLGAAGYRMIERSVHKESHANPHYMNPYYNELEYRNPNRQYSNNGNHYQQNQQQRRSQYPQQSNYSNQSNYGQHRQNNYGNDRSQYHHQQQPNHHHQNSQSNYSSSSYYQNRGPYQQQYTGYGHHQYSQQQNHYQQQHHYQGGSNYGQQQHHRQQPAPSVSNLSSYYTSDYVETSKHQRQHSRPNQ